LHDDKIKQRQMVKPELTLREYRAGDWRAMWALDVTCFEPVFRFSRRAMREFAEAAGAVTILAESGDKGELAGFCIVQQEQRVGYVVTLDVAAGWRRQGLARQLMDEVERRVRVASGLAMALHVYTGNAGAIRFYEAMGYARAGAAEAFYGRGLDAWVYEKRLSA
jgi:ribosomal protein S18 acetylase RimI-like enzyme